MTEAAVPLERYTAIMGPSGSGKSTLMHCLAGLDRITSGQIFIGDIELNTLSEKQLTLLRRDKVGFVFQAFNLLPTLTAAVLGLAVGVFFGWTVVRALRGQGITEFALPGSCWPSWPPPVSPASWPRSCPAAEPPRSTCSRPSPPSSHGSRRSCLAQRGR